MSDPEELFLGRWSRLKRETAKENKEKRSQAEAAPSRGKLVDERTAATTEQAANAKLQETCKPTEPVFDLASLPSVDSIVAASDIRAFLQSGVPAELTKAALRRAWTVDPAIRDFVGIAENQWDFTDPTAMPGFGPLEATDDVRQLVAQAMGQLSEKSGPSLEAAAAPAPDAAAASNSAYAPSHAQAPAQVSGIPEGNATDVRTGQPVEEQDKCIPAAPQHVDAPAENGTVPNRRTHGRALPQ